MLCNVMCFSRDTLQFTVEKPNRVLPVVKIWKLIGNQFNS